MLVVHFHHPFTLVLLVSQLIFNSLQLNSLWKYPKMNRAGTVVSSRGSIIYTGSIIGLDEQPSVYLIFGTTFTIICLTHRVNKYYATEDTEYLKAKVIAFIDNVNYIFLQFYPTKICWKINSWFTKNSRWYIHPFVGVSKLYINTNKK